MTWSFKANWDQVGMKGGQTHRKPGMRWAVLIPMGDSYNVTAAGKPGAFIMNGVRKG